METKAAVIFGRSELRSSRDIRMDAQA